MKERLAYVDILRVLAMVPVVVCHFTRSLESAGIGYAVKILPDQVFGVYLGDFGVCIFFVLSGISLMYTYDGKLDIKKYIQKRFMGIFPMFWLTWTLACLYRIYKEIGLSNWTEIPASKIIFTLIGMDGYTLWYGQNFYLVGEWFLGCIILLYILFPILKKGIEKKPYFTGIIILLIYIIGPIFYNGKIPVSIFFMFRVPEFAFGMYWVKYIKHSKWYMAMFGFLLLVCFEYFNVDGVQTLYKNTLIAISVLVVIEFLCQFIKLRYIYNFFSKIGKYCYAVFLTHHFVIQELLENFRGKNLLNVEVYAIFCMCVFVVIGVTTIVVIIDKNIKYFIKNCST